MKRSFRLLLYDISLVWECISSGCVSPATSSHSHVLSASLTPSVCDLSLPLFPGKLSPSHYSVQGLSVPRWELLQPCDNERSPFRSSLHINGSPAEAAARRVGSSCGSWGQCSHGDGMWDRAGHIQGLPQLQGRTIWGKKGGEETSSIDASGQHGFHDNPCSLFLLGVDATKRLLT